MMMMRRTLVYLTLAGSLAACTSLLGDFDGAKSDNTTSDGGTDGTTARDGATGDVDLGDTSSDDGAADASQDVGVDVPPGPPTASVNRTEVRFGNVDCGGTAPADQTIQISNSGGSPLTWSATIDSTAEFTLGAAASGSIAVAGAPASLTVSAKAIAASSTAGSLRSATITITTNDAQHAQFVVPVNLVVHGGTLTVTPGSASFGQVPLNSQAPDIGLAITNTGNGDVTVGFTPQVSGDFTFAWTGAPTAVLVPAGASVPGALARFKPTSLAAGSATVNLTVTGAQCGASAASFGMSGQGVAGLVGVSPGTLDFGAVNCGAQAVAKSITVTNTGNVAFHVTGTSLSAAIAPYYSVTTPNGTTVAPNSSIPVVVTPAAIANAASALSATYNGTITVTTDAAGDSPHTVTISEAARGAVVSLTPAPPAALAFGTVNLGASPTSNSFTFTNSGNLPANYSASVTLADYKLAAASGTIAASSTSAVPVTFTPTTNGPRNDTVTLSVTAAAFCGPPPPASLPLTGTGGCPPPSTFVQVNATRHIDATEVTNAQYLCYLAAAVKPAQPPQCAFNGSFTPSSLWPPAPAEMQLPVVFINWCQAANYCAWAGRKLCGATLGGPGGPTDFSNPSPANSMWTYACSANGANAYPYGPSYDATKCETSEHGGFGRVPVGSLPQCVGASAPFSSIYDMSGNVLEWEDGCDANGGSTDHCLTRGGAYDYSSLYDQCSSVTTPAYTRGAAANDLGFRCCD